jgi:hypothetical protein
MLMLSYMMDIHGVQKLFKRMNPFMVIPYLGNIDRYHSITLHREGHYLLIVHISRPCDSWDADKGLHSLGAKIIVPPQF